MLLANASTFDFIGQKLLDFFSYTGFANVEWANIIMILVGAFFIWLAIKKDFEPLLLIPIGLGIILGNIPFKDAGLEIGLYEDNSVLNIFYQGVKLGWYPPLVFLGIGAMTDFSALIANPKLMLIGAAAQFGIFAAYMAALAFGFEPNQAAGIAIIGGADGPTAIFLSSKLSPNLMGAIAVCAYSYMALVPVIQPGIMKLLTTKEQRKIKMKPSRQVSQTEKMLFPVVGLLITTFIVPSGLPLLGDNTPCQDSRQRSQRHRCHAPRSHSRMLYTGFRVHLMGHYLHLRRRRMRLHRSHSKRSMLRPHHEPLLAKGRENQSSHRKCRRISRTYGSPHLSKRRSQSRPTQLPPHARHGT